MTDAERVLWRLLRDRRFSGLKFRREHPFGEYILDFACLEMRLILEVDGGQHGEQQEYDEEGTRNLQAAGFRLIRFWNNEVLHHQAEAVKERIWLTLQEIQERK